MGCSKEYITIFHTTAFQVKNGMLLALMVKHWTLWSVHSLKELVHAVCHTTNKAEPWLSEKYIQSQTLDLLIWKAFVLDQVFTHDRCKRKNSYLHTKVISARRRCKYLSDSLRHFWHRKKGAGVLLWNSLKLFYHLSRCLLEYKMPW